MKSNIEIERMFDFLVEFRKKINAPLPKDKFEPVLELEDDIIPGCFLIYIPGLQPKLPQKRLYHFHFMACSEIMRDKDTLLIYRITNRLSGEFEMFNGSLQRLPVCKKCLKEWDEKRGWKNFSSASPKKKKEIADNFSIIEFFETCGYKSQIEEKILNQIWMGMMFRNDKYPEYWSEISDLYREAADWKCEECGNDCRNNKKSLHTHHKNRFKPDTRRENLQVLCDKCHGKKN